VTGWPGRRPASGVRCLTRLRAGDPGRVRRLAEIPRRGALPRRHEPVRLAGHPVIVVHGPNDSGVPPGWSPASPGVISGRLWRQANTAGFDVCVVKEPSIQRA
jgi:hypothetical protein